MAPETTTAAVSAPVDAYAVAHAEIAGTLDEIGLLAQILKS